jgi:hypothetical protein
MKAPDHPILEYCGRTGSVSPGGIGGVVRELLFWLWVMFLLTTLTAGMIAAVVLLESSLR